MGEEHVFCVVNVGVKPLFFITVACVCSTKGSVFWDAPRENRYEERSQWRAKIVHSYSTSKGCEEY